jgi:hypothetical protein
VRPPARLAQKTSAALRPPDKEILSIFEYIRAYSRYF